MYLTLNSLASGELKPSDEGKDFSAKIAAATRMPQNGALTIPCQGQEAYLGPHLIDVDDSFPGSL